MSVFELGRDAIRSGYLRGMDWRGRNLGTRRAAGRYSADAGESPHNANETVRVAVARKG